MPEDRSEIGPALQGIYSLFVGNANPIPEDLLLHFSLICFYAYVCKRFNSFHFICLLPPLVKRK